MSKTRILTIVAATVAVVVAVFLAIRAFQPPLPLTKLEAVKPGMSRSQVLEVLGAPTRRNPSRSYAVNGTNYQTGELWNYQRALTFGFINVLFDTNGVVKYGEYEEF